MNHHDDDNVRDREDDDKDTEEDNNDHHDKEDNDEPDDDDNINDVNTELCGFQPFMARGRTSRAPGNDPGPHNSVQTRR